MHLREQPDSRHGSYRPLWVSFVLVLGVALLLLNACSSTAGSGVTSANGQSGLPTANSGSGSNGGGGNSGGSNPTATTGSGSGGGGSSNPTATTGSGGGSNPTATPAPPAHHSFVWTATNSNITSNWTIIDSSFTNGDAGAVLIVTPYFNPNSVYDNHPIGVWYTGGRWTIFHQDQSPMIVGASFNVLVYSSYSPGVGYWGAASISILNNQTLIVDTVFVPAGSSAQLLVTPYYNLKSVYDDHPIGVWWTGSEWAIFNQDLAAMPVGAAFLFVSAGGASGGFVQTATSGNSAGDYTVISGNSATDNQPGAVLNCTPLYNPNNVYDDHNIGVWYDAPHWTIFNQDQSPIPNGASFDCIAS